MTQQVGSGGEGEGEKEERKTKKRKTEEKGKEEEKESGWKEAERATEEKIQESKEEVRERNSSINLFTPNCPQQPGVGQVTTRSLVHLSLPHGYYGAQVLGS